MSPLIMNAIIKFSSIKITQRQESSLLHGPVTDRILIVGVTRRGVPPSVSGVVILIDARSLCRPMDFSSSERTGRNSLPSSEISNRGRLPHPYTYIYTVHV